ncbi:hypothetical protein OK074_6596, partial [Actinobacteria bacterium OK074]
MLVEDHDGLLLLRLPTDDHLRPGDIAELSRTLGPRKDGPHKDTVVTVVAGADSEAAGALWPRLGEVLDSLREAGTRSVRLVVPGAGHDLPEQPAVARRVAAAWDLTVEAPDGPVLVVPGGSLFVPPGDGGWWRFAPGLPPVPLGPRLPAPGWGRALREIPAGAVPGCTVDQLPAGLLIRPVEATAPRPGDLFHAIPVDPKRPAVVVGVPFGEDIAAADVTALLSALPPELRSGVRLVPGGRRDLLPLGRAVAAALGTEVEVVTGLPLFAAGNLLDRYGVRSVLAGPDGTPRWLPYLDAVLCAPPKDPDNPDTAVPPRPLRWFTPPGLDTDTEDRVVRLSDSWRATLTRSGLWVGPHGGPPVPHSGRPVHTDGPVVEIGHPGVRLDPSLRPALARLFTALTPPVLARTTLHVHGIAPDGGRALRELAAEQGINVVRFDRPPTPAPAPALTAAPGPGPTPVPTPVPAPAPAPSKPGAGAAPPVTPPAGATATSPSPAPQAESPTPEASRPDKASPTEDSRPDQRSADRTSRQSRPSAPASTTPGNPPDRTSTPEPAPPARTTAPRPA